MLRRFVCGTAVLLGLLMNAPAGADSLFVAGLQPHQRTAGAPTMRASDRDRAAARQFRGIVKPYPQSLGFASNHGGWFTPFTEPGMTGRYDLRLYHQASANDRKGGKVGG